MKIAQLVSNLHTVEPRSTHAIYSHVAWLTNGLVKKGHGVDLFAAGDSNTRGELHAVTPKSLVKMNIEERQKQHYMHLINSECYKFAPQVDIVHSHFNLMSSFYSPLVSTPTVHSIHSPIPEETKPILTSFKHNKYISFSLAQRKQMPDLNWYANIYHGVNMDMFSFNPHPHDYLLYLGRITKEKGVHYAIETAKATKIPLVIAGRSYPTESYWQEEIEPHIDGRMIQYVGEAGFDKKIELLQNARALLFPTQYNEVFGYVMIEALACGTPVIAWKNGSISEVIADKKTGYVIESALGMTHAVRALDKIRREDVRKRAELYFSVEKMVDGYSRVYERIITEEKYKKDRKNAATSA